MITRSFILAMHMWLLASASQAGLVVIGTLQWAGSSAPPKTLIYDDKGRRAPNGAILGGLIWLDQSYRENDMRFDAALGTGQNARLFAQAMTAQSGSAIITLRPGFSIVSWDGGWRLPHAGSAPAGNPGDSEFLHLVIEELGNSPGRTFSRSNPFERLLVQSPDEPGSGFFGYWLGQDTPTQTGTEIWFNTRTGQQETVPEAYHGGYVIFVRNATITYDPQAPGAAGTPAVVNQPEGHTISAGTSSDLDAYRSLYDYTPAAGKAATDIVGMAIAGSNDHVYTWYRDGTVSSGSTSDLDQFRAPYGYSLPPGKTPADIVGMAIAGSNDRVYAWYRDGTVSSGSSSDLDLHRAPYGYSLPPGMTPADIVAMAIAGSNDHVYAWYRDGSVSSGSSSELDAHRGRYGYELPLGKTPEDIVGMAIAGSDDRVYTWYRPYIR